MTYEKILRFVYYMRWMQERELDVVSMITAPKGLGKSNAAIAFTRLYVLEFGLDCIECKHHWITTNKVMATIKAPGDAVFQNCPRCKCNKVKKSTRLDFFRYLAYDNDEVQDKIYDLPEYSPIIPDEGVRFAMAEDWNKYESKEMKKLFAQMRTKKMLIFINFPKFSWADGKYRNDMTTFWIRILSRGVAVILQPDLGEAEDPWYMKEFRQLLGSYFHNTPEDELIEKAERIFQDRKYPCCVEWLKIPKVPEDIYKEYLEARNAKVFTRKLKDNKINQKDVGKIAAYNLLNRWDELQSVVKEGKLKRPTLKMLSEYIFSDPKSKLETVGYTTIQNWTKEIDRIVAADEKKSLTYQET